MNKCRILIGQGCRSDYGLSNPIIKELRTEDWCEVKVIELIPASFESSYNRTKAHCIDWKPDLFLAIGDRIEMTGATAAAFHTDVKIAHYGAGVTNYPISTYDDINRHYITLCSDVQLCESEESRKVVVDLFTVLGLKRELRVYNVGITHLDDITIDESLKPNHEYDLVLYNPTTMYEEEIPLILSNLSFKKRVWIGPNPDPKSKLGLDMSNPNLIYYENLPRSQFFGLLKNCKTFVTNSSSAYYEAPEFLNPEQIVIIGDRNKNRNTPKNLQKGGSRKIVINLKGWWLANEK